MKNTVFCSVTPCTQVKVHLHFGQLYTNQFQDQAMQGTCLNFLDPEVGDDMIFLNVTFLQST